MNFNNCLGYLQEEYSNRVIYNYLGQKTCRSVRGLNNVDISSNKFKGEKEGQTQREKKCYNHSNFKLKQNKNRINRKERKENNISIPHSLGEKQGTNSALTLPSAPHNTSQYLIENFSLGRKENIKYNPFALIFAQDWDNEPEEIDDICITGGTMKGAEFNSESEEENKEQSESTEMSTEEETIQRLNNIEHTPEDEISKLKKIIQENEKKIKELEYILENRNLQYEYS